jgi:hypothetical protein
MPKPLWKTNKIEFKEEDGKKVVIKKFNYLKPAAHRGIINAFTLLDWFIRTVNSGKPEVKFYSHSANESINNEIKARKILSDLGIKAPKILWSNYSDRSICME